MISAQNGYAKPDFPSYVRVAAGVKANGVLDKASVSCTLCHAPAPPKVNPFGEDLKVALHQANSTKLTPAIFNAIAEKDSDGDGFTNTSELTGDTLPGDAANKPAGLPNAASAVKATNGEVESPGLFSPKTLLFPDHGQHPVFVHFPIALFLMSVVLDILWMRKRQESLHQAAYFNLIAAAITSPLAVISGLISWQVRLRGAPLEGLLLNHLLLGISTSILLFALWGVRVQNNKKPAAASVRLYVILSVLLMILISLTGHLGGAMVYGG